MVAASVGPAGGTGSRTAAGAGVPNRIDHFMYAVASLDEGVAWAADTFGVTPAYGGEHVGLGTRNALLSLGETYLEIIAPDPAQPLTANLGGRFAELSEGGLVTWAVQGKLADIAHSLGASGLKTAGPSRTERKTAEGELLVWELLFPVASPHGPRMPFFIDWLACAHPSIANPLGGHFRSLTITDADAVGLRNILGAIGIDVAVVAGEPGLNVEIETPTGMVTLSSTAETAHLNMV